MKRQPIDLYNGPTTLALDVSAHQGAIDWDAVTRSEATLGGRPQGRPALVIVRTSDGVQTRPSSRPDPNAVRNLRGAHDAGLRCAVYHFLRAHHDAAAQTELMLEVLAVAGVPIVFAAIDVEGRPDDPSTSPDEGSGAWWRPAGAPAPDTLEVLRDVDAMRLELERRDHRVAIYSGVAWHYYVAQLGHDVSRYAGVPLWTPYYTSGARPLMPVGRDGRGAPWSTWTLWQYSSKGRIEGIAGSVDLNRFRGDRDAFEAWCDARRAPSEPRAALLRDLDGLLAAYAGDPELTGVLADARGRLEKPA